MFAVIRTGGKQYKVKTGDLIRVEKLDIDVGETVEIEDVLMVADDNKVALSAADVEGARVSAKVNAHGRSPKIKVIKFRRRKHHRKQMGHRQAYTELSILDIKPDLSA